MGKKKEKEELPDYTVADMDLDGMPWNRRRPWQTGSAGKQKMAETDLSSEEEAENPYTPEETRGLIWGALKAALLIGLAFVLAAFLFLLFCVFVWLR